MVKPFLPEIPKDEKPLSYLLGRKGYKDFQRLVEDTNPYGGPLQDTDAA